MDWLRNIKLKDNNNSKTAATFTGELYMRLDSFSAAQWNKYNGIMLKWGDFGPFCNQVSQKRLLVIGTNTDDMAINETDGQAAGNKLLGKPANINLLMLEEIIFRLEEVIFETDVIGRNMYYLLRRLMRDYKVNANRRIKR